MQAGAWRLRLPRLAQSVPVGVMCSTLRSRDCSACDVAEPIRSVCTLLRCTCIQLRLLLFPQALHMGQAASSWIEQRYVDDPLRLELERCMVKALDKQMEIVKDVRHRTRTVGGEHALRPIDVVPESVAEELCQVRSEDIKVMQPYFDRASVVEPWVEKLTVKLGQHVYDMPRIVLREMPTPAEIAAMSKQHLTRAMVHAKRLLASP